MGAFDFFKPTSPLGGHSRVRSWPVKSTPTGFSYGNPVIVASGTIDIAGSNPTTVSVVGMALTQSADVNGVQPGNTGYVGGVQPGGGTILPVALKTMEDEWCCHNFSTAGSGTLVAPSVANAIGVQCGIFFGTVTPTATDVRGTSTIANTFAVDSSQSAKHFEVVRVLDKNFKDITVSSGTGEYVVVRWLNVTQ